MNPATFASLTRWLPLRSLRSGAMAAFAAAALALWAPSGFAQAPPAGTPIGNQASATYVDATSTSRTVTSNLVTTIVQQVASLLLTSNGLRTAAPGAPVVFPHTVTNTGNGPDSLTLSTLNLGGDTFNLAGLSIYVDTNGDGIADNFTPLTSTGPIAAGASFRFVVQGSVPGTQVATDFALVRVTATSTFDNTQTAFNTDRVDVTGNAVINVSKGVSAPSGLSPSGPYTYTISYSNSGNATATNVRLTDVLPAGMNYANGSAVWSVGSTSLTDADTADVQGTPPNTIRYEAQGGTVTAILAQVAPGASGTVSFDVNVASGLAPQTILNNVAWRYNDGAGNVGPFVSNSAPFQVLQTASLTFTGQTIPSALQGSVVTFTNTLTNTGNGFDQFDITIANNLLPPGSSYQLLQSNGITPLTDTNGNFIPDTGPIGPGVTTTVVLRVTLPSGAAGGPWSVQKVATSDANPGVQAVATDVITTILGNTVDLTNDTPIPGAPGEGPGPELTFVIRNTTNPGLTTRFTLVVNNTSAQADAFTLNASTDATFATLALPAGWSVTFRNTSNAVITGTTSIPAGGNQTVYADVDVPAGTLAQDYEIYFRSRSAVSLAQDVIHDQVRVNQQRSLTLVPNNSAQVVPGGFVVYAHLLTNTGNVVEGDAAGSFVALSATDNQAGWSTALYWDTNNSGGFDAGDLPIADLTAIGGLAPGASVRLFAQVFCPAGAPFGQINTTSVSAATTNLAYTSTVPAVATALDVTTVINGQLTIVKRQATDTLCVGAPDGAFSTLTITSGSKPGACIRYEITVTNVGSTPVTGVVVNDATPANTVSSNSASATSTVGTISVPPDGTTGSIVANVGLLGPGQSAVITFSVRINN